MDTLSTRLACWLSGSGKRNWPLLRKIRSIATKVLRDGAIIKHGKLAEIWDPHLQMELNELRREIVKRRRLFDDLVVTPLDHR